MSLTAYVRIRGSYIEEPVTYDLGPVWVTKSLIDGFYTKTGFNPQATAPGGGFPQVVVFGDGSSISGASLEAVGPVTRYGSGTSALSDAPTIAAPDEMLPSQALRDRVYNMDYLTFYGPAAEGITGTGGTNQFTVATGHGLYNGQLVTLTTTGTLPTGLSTNTLYYIVGRTATTVAFALTPGGSAITYTGSGTHKIVPFTVAGEFARNLNPRWSNGQGRLVA